MAGPDMMSRFSKFEKVEDRQWIRLSKIGRNSDKSKCFCCEIAEQHVEKLKIA
jgi:hypothetical protein